MSNEHKQYVGKVEAAAANGSKTAKEVLTIWSCMQKAMANFKQSENGKMVAELAKAIRLDHQIVEIPELLTSVLKKHIKARA